MNSMYKTEEAYRSLPCGVIMFSDDTGEISDANDAFYNITDTQPEQCPRSIVDIADDGDRDFVRHFIKQGAGEAADFRIVTPMGLTKWLHMTLFSNGGKMYAIVDDNTSEHELITSLNDESFRYRFAVASGTSTIFEYNFKLDVCRFYEPDAEQGQERYSENGTPEIRKTVIPNFSSAIFSDAVIFSEDAVKMVQICSGSRFSPFEVRQTKPWLEDAPYLWYRISGHVIYSNSGEPLKTIGTMVNIDEQKRTEADFSDSAMRDSVSQLYNYVASVNKISEDMAVFGDGYLALVDVDDFKNIVDVYGDLYGDAVISMVSDAMRLALAGDETAVAGRIGGDKFIVYTRAGRTVCEKQIRFFFDKISSLTLRTVQTEVETPLSCSIGLAPCLNDKMTYEELFASADKALFIAKDDAFNGGACVFYDDIEDILDEDARGYINIHGMNQSFRSDFDLSEACFEILERTKNVKTSLEMLLRQISVSMNLTRISIMERGDKYEEHYAYSRAESRRLSSEDIEYINENYDDNVNIISLDDSHIFASGSKMCIITARLIDKSGYRGFMVLYRDTQFTEKELNTVREISRVLSVHLGRNKLVDGAKKRYDRLLNFDTLTGLPTLKQLRDRMDAYIATHPKQSIVVIYSDFYHFHNMNQLYGFEEGDRVLKEFADLMMKIMGETFQVNARISGDEFVTALAYVNDDIFDFVDILNNSFCTEMNNRYPQANIIIRSGVYLLPPGNQFIEGLDKADLARKSIDHMIACQSARFDERMNKRIQLEAEMSRTMRRAVEDREFAVYLQPKVSLDDYKIIGAEALVRWIRPDGSMIMPSEFVPYFERNGFITNVDFCVYEQVMEMLHEWQTEGIQTVPVSINMSRMHGRNTDTSDRIFELMKKNSITPDMIEFEVTETALASCDENLKKCLADLHDSGILINIDDFGSGYSSLNLLTEVTADIIKLDKTLITESISSPKKAEIVRCTVSMAHAIDYDVLCEGVEEECEVEFLRSIGCMKVQGFYFSRPVPADVFKQMLKDGKPLA